MAEHCSPQQTPEEYAEAARKRAQLHPMSEIEKALFEALKPFVELIEAFDAGDVAGARALQPEDAASMSDEELAALVSPDDKIVALDNRMSFGRAGSSHERKRITVGDFRRLRAALASLSAREVPSVPEGEREAFETGIARDRLLPLERSGDRYDYDITRLAWIYFHAAWQARAASTDGWLPMESAPKDGTRFVAICHRWPYSGDWGGAKEYVWVNVHSHWQSIDGYLCIRPDCAEHFRWMPLPTPNTLPARTADPESKGGDRGTLSDEQLAVLRALAAGHRIAYSQDGDMAWLHPKHETGFLSDACVIGLRDMGFIEKEPRDEDEHVRFGPGDTISPAGRNVLQDHDGAASLRGGAK